MEEHTHLPQSQLNGLWKASYSNVEGLSDHDTDEEEQATLKFDEGLLSGDDHFGGKYAGMYSVSEGKFSAKVEVTSPGASAQSILGIDFPYTLEFFGDYSNPDHFTVMGKVTGLEMQVVVNCRRITESSNGSNLSSIENEKNFADDSSFEKDGR